MSVETSAWLYTPTSVRTDRRTLMRQVEEEIMDEESAEMVAEKLEDEGYESSVRPDYSGRGMYGATCVAIVTDAPMTLVGWACGAAGLSSDCVPTRSDNMGRSMVIY